MKVGLCNLGCKVNTYEMEYIASLFKERGYEICDFNDFCDVYVVNTCTVTNNSDVKSRKMINHPKKINKNSCLVVCGCFIESAKDYKNDDIETKNIKNYYDKNISTTLMIDNIKEVTTKNNDIMAFINASDEFGNISLILFPKTYKQYNNISKKDIIKIYGRVEKRNQSYPN